MVSQGDILLFIENNSFCHGKSGNSLKQHALTTRIQLRLVMSITTINQVEGSRSDRLGTIVSTGGNGQNVYVRNVLFWGIIAGGRRRAMSR